jgi:hypothetical protein
MRPQFEPWRDLLQRGRGALAAGQAVGEDADMMAAVRLPIGKVEDMAKNPADRCAYRMQDSKRSLGGGGHDQIQPSPRRATLPAPVTAATGSAGIAGDGEMMARAARMWAALRRRSRLIKGTHD